MAQDFFKFNRKKEGFPSSTSCEIYFNFFFNFLIISSEIDSFQYFNLNFIPQKGQKFGIMGRFKLFEQ
jgi:hypothetical protein